MTGLPETWKKGGHVLHLVREEGTGRPLVGTLYQIVRWQTHMEAQGYITGYKFVPDRKDLHAAYISDRPVAGKIQLTKKMGGKMKGMQSLNTATNVNPACNRAYEGKTGKNCNPKICKACYSMDGLVEGKSGVPPKATSIPMLMRNTRLLTRGPLEYIPKVKAEFFRFSSEGDLYNQQHLLNLYAIAKANPQTRFTLWTKRHEIVAPVMAAYGKPRNLHLIQSSLRVNTPENLRPGYSKVFTVYTKDYLAKHPEIKINCGSKSCYTCRLCYSDNSTVYVNEIAKGNKLNRLGKIP